MTKSMMFLGAATVAVAAAMPVAQAQDATVGKRVERLEKEMRAVQRAVFPGGAPTFFEGEIAPDNTPGVRSGSSNAPVADLTARVDALEAQLQTLTGQTEQNSFQLRELEKQFTAYKAEMEKRFAPPEPPAADPAATPASLPVVPTPRPTPAPTPVAAAPAKKPTATKAPATKAPATKAPATKAPATKAAAKKSTATKAAPAKRAKRVEAERSVRARAARAETEPVAAVVAAAPVATLQRSLTRDPRRS